jgi:hypothetical protein
MDIYFQTATGFGTADSEANVPAGAIILTKAQYDALLAGAQADADQAAADALTASRLLWVQVHGDLVASGVTDATATVLADAVATRPLAG